MDDIQKVIGQVDPKRIRQDLFYLCHDPLPYRKLNYTLPGHSRSTLDEADAYLEARLRTFGYAVEREPVQVQAFRRDESKPKAHQYATPCPDDPWYTAHNLYAKKRGSADPEGIILLLAHKDSQSWVDSPGAYDNGVGTVALLEIARRLAPLETRHSIWFLFCNEEHRPWTSVTAANKARERGDRLIAIFNTDSLGGKSQADIDAGRRTNVTLYTQPEGERFADLMAEVNRDYEIGLIQRKERRESPGDDDGSYIKAGYPMAVVNVGSHPYADPAYHTEQDTPDRVDLINVAMATQAILAACLRVDRGEY